eukprot:2445813-Alexandrium_andersonii.AAC.1
MGQGQGVYDGHVALASRGFGLARLLLPPRRAPECVAECGSAAALAARFATFHRRRSVAGLGRRSASGH